MTSARTTNNQPLTTFSSPEGRVVKNGSNLEYQYAISDHQGNTRILFTSATPDAVVKTATFEGDGGDNSDTYTNVSNVVSFTAANHTPSGIKVVRMNQTYPVGPAKSLKVYPGDKVDMQVYAYFENSSGYGTGNNTTSAMITAIAGAFGGAVGVGESGNIYDGVNAAITGFGLGANPGDTRPSAFINYILFDKNYKLLDMGWTVVPASANSSKQQMTIPQVTVKEAGYIFVYLSYEDESNNYVYFDDFKVTHTPSNLIQTSEYYPFGMQTANSWTRESVIGNDFLANGGTELNTTTSVYDLDYRNYDPILGRMNQVDPMMDKYGSISPYNFSFNNPVLMIDPDGADPENGRDDTRANMIANYYLQVIEGGGGNGGGPSIMNSGMWGQAVADAYSYMRGDISSSELIERQGSKLELWERWYTSTTEAGVSSSEFLGYVLKETVDKNRTGRQNQMQSDKQTDHEYHQWNGLTESEKKLLISNPLIVFQLQANQDLAFKATDKYFKTGSHYNDSADAFRHSFFNALNTRSFGYTLAKQLGDAHEDFSENDPLEKKMDLNNNREGRIFGQKYGTPGYSNDQIAGYIYDAVMNGQMKVINGARLGPSGK